MQILERIKKNWGKGYISVLKDGGSRWYLTNGISEGKFCDSKEGVFVGKDLHSNGDYAEWPSTQVVDTIHITELAGKFKKGDKFRVKETGEVKRTERNVAWILGDDRSHYKLTEIEPYFCEEEKEINEPAFRYIEGSKGLFVDSTNSKQPLEFIEMDSKKYRIDDIRRLKPVK